MSGLIHVKLTWVPKFADQPRPQAIIIEEYCQVVAGAHSQALNSVTSADNGLGDTATVVKSNQQRYDSTSTSEGRHYRTKPEQNDIANIYDTDDRTERPSLDMTYEWDVNISGSAKGVDQAQVSFAYTCLPHVVNIQTNGTLNSSLSNERKLLVGQGISPVVFPYNSNDPAIGGISAPGTPADAANVPDISRYTTQHVRWTFDKSQPSTGPNTSSMLKDPFFHWKVSDIVDVNNMISHSEKAAFVKFPQEKFLPVNPNDPNSEKLLVLEAKRTYHIDTANGAMVEDTNTDDRNLLTGREYFHWSLLGASTETPLYADATLTIGRHTDQAGNLVKGTDLKFKLSQKITILRPDVGASLDANGKVVKGAFAQAKGDINIVGNRAFDPNNPNNIVQSPWMQACALQANPQAYPLGVGEKWTGVVQEPYLFERSPGLQDERVGFWNFVQLIAPGRSIVEGGVSKNWKLNSMDLTLDNFFPYPAQVMDVYATIYDSNSANMIGEGWKAYYPNTDPKSAPKVHSTSDSPYIPLSNAMNVRYDSAHMADKLEVYLMYLPPDKLANGDDRYSEWVPLQMMKWQTFGESVFGNVIYIDPAVNNQREILNHNLAGGTITVTTAPMDVSGHPLWGKKTDTSKDNLFDPAAPAPKFKVKGRKIR